MSDDTDLLFAAAATAALVTWMGTRHRGSHARSRRTWRGTLDSARALLRRTWHETPGYVFVKAIVELLRRR
jgi:hypothetical protein